MISLRVSATNLAKGNEPEENPQDFPSNHRTSNALYTLLAHVLFFFQNNLHVIWNNHSSIRMFVNGMSVPVLLINKN